ncbi:HEAT repeat-containing protein 4 [Spea bombifrons]|uniref:HEAT repeat-containing protein 4 n=1 Tax=Spea bombifrons TaxID=233779 RepID=UPI00234B552F|nr:HEAT repeat-containing protein 4 [Spea bombifrons]
MEFGLHNYGHSIFSQESSQRLPKCQLPSHSIHNTTCFSFPISKSCPTTKHPGQFQSQYIKKIAGDLRFSKDVVRDRSLGCLPYKEWNAKGLYDASDIVSRECNQRMSKVHLPQRRSCYMKNASSPKQMKTRTCFDFGKSIWKVSPEGQQEIITDMKSKYFLTEAMSGPSKIIQKIKHEGYISSACSSKGSLDCCEEVLKMLTKTTAQWIVSHHTADREVRDRMLRHYSLMGSAELISEEQMKEGDFRTLEELEESKLLYSQTQEKIKDPEMLLPVYYRIPEYLPRPKKHEEIGSRNKTAESLSVKHYEPKTPLRLQDMINPRVGKYVKATDNAFEGELYSGISKIIHQKNAKKKNIIYMDSHNHYDKHLQEIFPKSYQNLVFMEENAGLDMRPGRGAIRWIALPTPPGDGAETEPSTPPSKTPRDANTRTRKIQDTPLDKRQVLKNILTHWREAWTLSVNWQEATIEQLERDLRSVHNAQKISALVTIASAATERPQQQAKDNETAISHIPAETLPLISSALRDDDSLVRMAAALCHFFIQETNEEARKVMLTALEKGSDADSWASAQCLALEGNHDYLVVRKILAQLFDGGRTEKQACYLLGELSKSTDLIHAMLGSELNSCNWKHRIVACRTISQLHGPVSQDLRNKLNHVMWEDWNMAVRWAAAKALGQMGHGKEIHDQLRKHLESGNWMDKVESLSLIAWLQFMTAQLLPGFLQCFSDDYIAVRRQACLTAGSLRIKDEMVLKCLHHLIQNDPIWKIQAFAIKALGKIGYVTPEVKGLLLRAVRSEEPGVRVEACRCIATLGLGDPEVQSVLQNRLALESHELVKREVGRTLTALNMEQDGNGEMRTLIQKQTVCCDLLLQISRLCKKDVLIPKVLMLTEVADIGQQNIELLTQKTPGRSYKSQNLKNVDKVFSGQSCLLILKKDRF